MPASHDRLVRLNKYLALCGVGSRRACDEVIQAGRVEIDGVLVLEPGLRFDTQADSRVQVDGRDVHPFRQLLYVVVHKPRGIVVTASDPEGRPTIFDLVPALPARVFPVGRLDVNTTGLVLLTNDGEVAQRLGHPRFQVPRVYRAKVSGQVPPEAIERLKEGVRLDDGPTAPAEARLIRRNQGSCVVELTVYEGRNRLVRRMMEKVGHPVRQLARVRLGPLVLDGLPLGKARPLLVAEAKGLRAAVGLSS